MTPLEVLQSEHAIFKLSASDIYIPRKPIHKESITISDLQSIPVSDLYNLNFGNWDGNIMLLPLWMLGLVANGEHLTSISGGDFVVGVSNIDDDTRAGLLAYGFAHPGLKSS